MSNENLDRIIKFLIENRWQYKFSLTREMQLQRDLKIWGDDADEILIKFSKEFGVDVSRFPIGEYFEDEGDQTFKDIFSFFSKLYILFADIIVYIYHLEKSLIYIHIYHHILCIIYH